MVDEKQFLQNFADQFDDEPEGLSMETLFRDIDGWSSIVALSIMAMCAEEYDVILSANEMENANRVSDIYIISQKRKNQMTSHLKFICIPAFYNFFFKVKCNLRKENCIINRYG